MAGPFDPNPALRQEYMDAKAILAPQIRGLHDMNNDQLSPESHQEIAEEIAFRENRNALLDAALLELDQVVTAREALAADGYPELPPAKVSDAVLAELSGEVSDVKAAASVFVLDSAVAMSVSLGVPVEKS